MGMIIQYPTVLPPCPSLSRPCSLSQESQKLLEHRYPELPPERRWRAKSNRSQPLLPLPLNRRTCGGMQHRAESEETAPHMSEEDSMSDGSLPFSFHSVLEKESTLG